MVQNLAGKHTWDLIWFERNWKAKKIMPSWITGLPKLYSSHGERASSEMKWSQWLSAKSCISESRTQKIVLGKMKSKFFLSKLPVPGISGRPVFRESCSSRRTPETCRRRFRVARRRSPEKLTWGCRWRSAWRWTPSPCVGLPFPVWRSTPSASWWGLPRLTRSVLSAEAEKISASFDF